ncbi:MAG: chemotaxis protein CheA [Oscillospiraceae bacterium]|nr:chemotaxis protein CheA [Oscillospiraceae bacterium]
MSSDPMLEMFIFESTQLTERLEEILIEGEQQGVLGEEHINEIFRVMHTIKGSAAMMEYNNIATVGHHVEDMFYFIRENHDVSPDWKIIVDLCLESADFFKQEVGKIQAGQNSDGDENALLNKITGYMNVLTGKEPAPSPFAKTPSPVAYVPSAAAAPPPPQEAEEEEDEEEADAGAPAAAEGELCYLVHVFFEDGCKMENIRAYQITNALSDFTSRIDSVPADLLEDCSDEIISNGVKLYVYTDQTYEKINTVVSEALFIKTFELTLIQGAETVADEPGPEPEPVAVEQAPEPAPEPKKAKAKKSAAKAEPAPEPEPAVAAEPVPAPAIASAPVPAAASAAAAPPAEVKQSFISVNVDKLDKLMDLAGELVISVAMVINNPDLEGLNLEQFEKAASMLSKNTSELQDIIMSVRMIPISSTFHKMHRIVRDVSRKLNKEVEFVILGEETEVDKNMIDNLSDPLMHIVRNSMDHGIENPEEREQAGKPRVGRIVLEARNSGSDVIITCTDNGRGLDRDKILAKAIAQGMLTKPESEYTDKEIYNFVMAPGFSTKDQVTELSGRGVGMDVAKKNIEKIGGTVTVDSTPGQGTVNTIRIPLTLAILAGIEIKVGSNFYLVPTLNIRESFKPQQEQIVVDPDGNEMILFRGECYPIVRLHSLFSVYTDVTKFEDGIMIMVEDEGHMTGVFADTLVGEQQVVVKPIPQFITERIGQIRGIAGCTILGNGNISLIIDIKSLTQ